MEFKPLQYITPNDKEEVIQATLKVLSAGVKWVQFRLKEVSDMEFLQLALEAKVLCESYGASFIINDRHHLIDEIEPDGIHLGLDDFPISEFKEIQGDKYYVGGTANSLSDIKYQYKQGADYIGLGPFNTTQTKKNLSPILGNDGYLRVIKEMRQEKIDIPVLAIGGIKISDLENLKETGVSGIAVSNGLHLTKEKEFVTRVKELWA
jgi:thiamine-phosphate pyrophosphorylase